MLPMNWKNVLWMFGAVITGLPVLAAQAGEDTFSQYREMMGDDNPAIFVVDEGADLWTTPQGPKQASLEKCDLGLGPGVVKGAYAQLPRYFEDVGRVMDVEARLVHCMVTLQGRDKDKIIKNPYSAKGVTDTEMEALVSYIASQSEGMPISPPQDHAEEKRAYAMGEKLFYYRAGPYDFSCATCHRQSGLRIRLQELPNLTSADGAASSYPTWPAYRVSQGVVRTMGWRLQNCARQQRLPQLQLDSEVMAALITYMAVNARGAGMAAPGLKR